MNEIFYFKELTVWQKAVEFATEVISTVESNTSERKHYRLLEQIESSATSVSMNIAEGKGRFSKKEFIQFLYIARGSMFETITLLNIFQELSWLDQNKVDELENRGLEITKMINGLINSIKE